MSEHLNLTREEADNATMELLIKIYTTNKALAATLFHILADGDEAKEDEYLKLYNDQCLEEVKTIFQDLFVRRGSFGVDDVLKDDQS